MNNTINGISLSLLIGVIGYYIPVWSKWIWSHKELNLFVLGLGIISIFFTIGTVLSNLIK